MSSDKKIGLWGPPDGSHFHEEVASEPVAVAADYAPPLPVDTRDVRSIRWGMKDVVWGFLLMIAFQIVISIGISVQAALSVMNSVEGISPDLDIDQMTEAMYETVYAGPWLLASALSMYLAWGIVLLRASKKKGFGTLAKDFWLRFNWKRDLIIGVVAAAGLRLLEQGFIWILTTAGVDISGADNSSAIVSQGGIWFFLNAIVVASLLAPIFEEVFFRGLIFQSVRRFALRRRVKHDGQHTWTSKHAAIIAAVISSVVFGFMHFQGTFANGAWFVVVQTGLIGLVLAFILMKTKRLGTVIAVHVMFNFSGILLSLLF